MAIVIYVTEISVNVHYKIVLPRELREATRVALYCQDKLSVCSSVTLRYRDHIGWNSAKIISLLISLSI